MGYKDSCYAGFRLDPADFLTRLQAQAGIQVGQWFVQQKDPRPFDQGPGNGNPLLLAAGKFTWPAVHQLVDLHQPGRFQSLLVHLGFRQFLCPFQILQRECDVLPDRQVRIQGITLEDHPDAAVFRRQLSHVIIPEENPPPGRLFQTADHVQCRGLAAAGRTQEPDQLAVRYFKIKIIDRDYFPAHFFIAVRIDLGQMLKNNFHEATSCLPEYE